MPEVEASDNKTAFSHCNTLVLVDDETAILSALERLLGEEDYQIYTFDQASKALEFCLTEPVAVVVSDVRMPDMDGVALMEQLALQSPFIERILLTGYADIDATIAAINKGHVSYFLDKPWDEEQLKRVIKKGTELANMRAKNAYLERRVLEQNEQLKQWNETLEAKVSERTEQLRDTYMMAFQTFSSLIEKRLGDISLNTQDIATLARILGKASGLSKIELKNLYLASMFSQAGKISFSDELLQRPFYSQSSEEREQFCQHPVLAEASLAFIEPMGDTGKLLHQHRERLDGKGYPDKLAGQDILPSALILGLVLNYLEAREGMLFERAYTHQEAVDMLKAEAGKAFPAALVELAIPLLDKWVDQTNEVSQSCLPISDLQSGMRLARDIYGPNGMLLLARYKKLDEQLIEGLRRIEKNLHIELEAYVIGTSFEDIME
jgi:response regulator RpfG family c-di-GMP phosphodiesterase